MSARLRRALLVSVGVILGLLLVIAVFGLITVRRSFPALSGRLQVSGLVEEVEVLRDAYGIPHIYAANEHDLAMAQGYIEAQDRFWQMDFWRHIGSGRLSEMFGESQLETDIFLRTLGWARVVEEELETIDPDTLSMLQAYADGVNAYLAQNKGGAISLEYAILGLLTPDYVPEPWVPLHSLTWAKVMAWDLGANMDDEIRNAVLLARIGPERLADFNPPYPAQHPLIVSAEENLAEGGATAAADGAVSPLALPGLGRLMAQIENLHALTGGGFEGIGSNNWVISGERTASGKPLLANDMHLGIQMPSIWYEIGLHCRPLSADCDLNVVGFSFPGIPAVVVGHNADIAWGVTNLGPDVQDIYLEKINPDNPDQYLVYGEWVDMLLVEETIQVAGAEPVQITVRYTRHGPLLSDVDPELAALGPILGESDERYALSMQWTALAPGTIVEALVKLDRAKNWEQFRAALHYWDTPAQNFVYADREGNIGYQSTGRIPQRATGDGSFPVAGWTDDYEWLGFIPFDALPRSYNPEKGFIVSANNAVVGDDYPYFITGGWDYGYRANRIVELLSGDSSVTAEDIATIHGDNYNASAARYLPLLKALEGMDEDWPAERLEVFDGWDLQDNLDSAPAALYNAFFRHLVLNTFGDELPEGWIPGSARAYMLLENLASDPNNAWWDDARTSIAETRDDILKRAFAAGVAEIELLLGTDPAKWRWGDLHTASFVNSTLGQSGIAPIEALFNRGPFPTSGNGPAVNATSWKVSAGYEVTWIPSERLIVDLDDLDASLAVHPTGQSGHAFHPNYIDMPELWRLIDYHPLPWTPAAVEASAVHRLLLVPEGK